MDISLILANRTPMMKTSKVGDDFSHNYAHVCTIGFDSIIDSTADDQGAF